MRQQWIALVVVAASEKHAEVRERGDCAGDRRGDGGGEYVAISHVREFVCQHASQLARAQELEDARGGRKGRIRAAPGCERVRLRFVDQVHPGHRQPCAARQLLDGRIERWRGGRVDLTGVVEPEHHRVRKPIRPQIRRQTDCQGHQHSLRSAQQRAHDSEQSHDGGHQKTRLEPVAEHRRLSFPSPRVIPAVADSRW